MTEIKKGKIDFSKVETAAMRMLAHVAEMEASQRIERDNRLNAVAWVRDRHRDELEFGVTTTITEDSYNILMQYIVDLRNVPQQDGFPTAIEWPELPGFLKKAESE